MKQWKIKKEQNLDNYNKNDIDDPDYECNTSLGRTTNNEMNRDNKSASWNDKLDLGV